MTTGSEKINDFDGEYEAEEVDISDMSGTNIYAENEGIRLGTAKGTGSLTITFDPQVCIRGVEIWADVFGSDTGVTLSVATSAHTTKETKSISSTAGDDIYNFTSFASDQKRSQTLTISNGAKGKRAVIYGITLHMAGLQPVYPTAINLGKDFDMSLGSQRVLSPSFTPSNTNFKQVTYTSSDPDTVSVSATGTIEALALGSATITASAATLTTPVEDTLVVTVVESVPLEKTDMAYTYKDYTKNNYYELSSCPTKESAKLLIIPIWFSDSDSYIQTAKKDQVRSDIQKAYLGTTEETGWHSVKSFYEEESKGALSFSGTVTDWYSISASSDDYQPNSAQDDTTSLVKTASDWYFNNNPSDSRTNYDCDGDGYLDGVMLIYGAPDDQTMGRSVSNLWAYCYWVQKSSYRSVTSPGANVYFWASYDFIYDASTANTRTGHSYGRGDCSHCNLDAHTFIHEMGHVFGLDDYYDYGNNDYVIAGGFSMQDYNVGGHDPYSVMAYGWASPYIPTESCIIELGAFQKTHDLILLTPSWNSVDSPFDEYLLLELYTPTGLNELDATYQYNGGYPLGPEEVGIRLWHVDARLLKNPASPSISNLTSDPSVGNVVHAFTNTITDGDSSLDGYGSPLGTTYEKYHQLHLIRNDTSASINPTSAVDDEDLFGDGSTFSMSAYSSQFHSGKMNSAVNLGWSFSVSIVGTGEDAVATVNCVKA